VGCGLVIDVRGFEGHFFVTLTQAAFGMDGSSWVDSKVKNSPIL
jgi:hypothetical protein